MPDRHDQGVESTPVHFGDLVHGAEHEQPLFARLFHDADQRRAASMSVLQSSGDGTVEAIEAVSRLLFATMEWVGVDGEPLANEFVTRIVSDFEDAADGMLDQKLSSVLDPCRDLMELSVLFREFRVLPHRFETWRNKDERERMRDFGFGRLLHARKSEPIDGLSDLVGAMTEYAAHSRTLHPAPPLTHPSELSRAPDRLAPGPLRWWVESMTSETIRHTMIALREFMFWHAARTGVHRLPFDPETPDYRIALDWNTEHKARTEAMIPQVVRDQWDSPYRPSPRKDERRDDGEAPSGT